MINYLNGMDLKLFVDFVEVGYLILIFVLSDVDMLDILN